MTAFDKKVNQIATRHGWNISPVSGWYIPAYSIVPMDRKERDQITAALNRCKSFHVDVLQAFSSCAWTCTILIRDRSEWEALQEHQHTADLIRNAFIEAYHFNGHDSTDALDGDDWFFTADNKTELKIYSRVNLVIDANGTPDDYSDDKVIDALFCNDCTED